MSGTLQEKILLFKLQVEQDPEAYAALYDLYVKRIYRFVFFKVSSHEEAEDITSEVFLKAWRYITEKKSAVESFSGLLYRLARNSIVDSYRAKMKKRENLSAEEIEVTDGGKWY